MKRDPHLPPPEVCDWLLERDWPGVIPETVITYPKGNPKGITRSERFDYFSTITAIGADQTCHISLPVEALEVLRADQRARWEAVEQKRAAMEPDELEGERQREEDRIGEDSELDLLRKILAEAEKVEHSAMATIGVFATAAVMMASQAFNLAYQPDEADEAQP